MWISKKEYQRLHDRIDRIYNLYLDMVHDYARKEEFDALVDALEIEREYIPSRAASVEFKPKSS